MKTSSFTLFLLGFTIICIFIEIYKSLGFIANHTLISHKTIIVILFNMLIINFLYVTIKHKRYLQETIIIWISITCFILSILNHYQKGIVNLTYNIEYFFIYYHLDGRVISNVYPIILKYTQLIYLIWLLPPTFRLITKYLIPLFPVLSKILKKIIHLPWDIIWFYSSLLIFWQFQSLFFIPRYLSLNISYLITIPLLGLIVIKQNYNKIVLLSSTIVWLTIAYLLINEIWSFKYASIFTLLLFVIISLIIKLTKTRSLHPIKYIPNKSVLMISLDQNLLSDTTADTLKRHQQYANYFSYLTIIVLTTKKHHEKGLPYQYHHQNLHVYATASLHPLLHPFSGVCYLIKTYIQSRFDIISTQDQFITGIIGLVGKYIFTIPLNVQLHSTSMLSKHWLIENAYNRYLQFIGHIIILKSDSIRVVSKKVKKVMRQKYPNKNISLIPVAVDIDYFYKPTETKKEIKKLITVGRLSVEKNHRLLISAFTNVVHKYPHLQLTIVGDGPLKANLKKLIEKLHQTKNITLTGAKNRVQVKRLLHTHDLFVLTSNYEGYALVLIEALAAGLPIITTNVGSVAEHSIPVTKIPINSRISLEKAIIKNITHPQITYSQAEKGQLWVISKFKPDKLRNSWVQLLRETHL